MLSDDPLSAEEIEFDLKKYEEEQRESTRQPQVVTTPAGQIVRIYIQCTCTCMHALLESPIAHCMWRCFGNKMYGISSLDILGSCSG